MLEIYLVANLVLQLADNLAVKKVVLSAAKLVLL